MCGVWCVGVRGVCGEVWVGAGGGGEEAGLGCVCMLVCGGMVCGVRCVLCMACCEVVVGLMGWMSVSGGLDVAVVMTMVAVVPMLYRLDWTHPSPPPYTLLSARTSINPTHPHPIRTSPLAYNATDASVAAALQQLPGLKQVTVLRDSDKNSLSGMGLRIAVLDPPGDLPLLRVNGSGLTGPGVSL